MKIVKHGDKNRVECYDCGSELQFDPSDVRAEHMPPVGPYEIEGSDRYTIECPESHTTIDVTSKIAYSLGNKIFEKERERLRLDYGFDW
jgi:hypothetical protein